MLFKKCSSFSFANDFSLFMNSDPLCIQRVMSNYFFCFTFLKTTFIMKYYSFEYFFDIQRHIQRDSTQHTETYMKSLVVMANFSG